MQLFCFHSAFLAHSDCSLGSLLQDILVLFHAAEDTQARTITNFSSLDLRCQVEEEGVHVVQPAGQGVLQLIAALPGGLLQPL
jgi:hypothetical protein